MTICRRLFFLAALGGMALLPLASDAQQGCYYSRNANYYTMTKQQTITYYYYQQQQTQQALYQQQQLNWTQTNVQSTPTALNRTPTQFGATPTAQQRTATQIQQQQQVQARTTTAINHSQTICNHTTPQLLTTGTVSAKTATNVAHTATAQHCTYTQQQHTATATAHTTTALHKTATPTKQTATIVNQTPTATAQTATVVQKTATQMLQTGTTWEKLWGQKTITTTQTVMTMTNSNCMQCHPGSQPPTGVMTAHAPRMPVGQEPGRFPMLAPRQQSYPMIAGRMPMLPTSVGGPVGQWPPMLARQSPLPQVIPATYRPPQMALATIPTLKLTDIPSLVRAPDTQSPRMKVDPLALTPRPAPLPETMTIDRLPVGVEPMVGLGLRPSGRGMDVFDQLTMMQQTPPASDVQAFVMPMSEEDLQEPPSRHLAAAVIQLPPAPAQPETLLGMGGEEPQLPVTPSAEPLSKRDPLEFFGASPQPASAVTPRPAPAVTQPGLPGDRDTELVPG
jgi:hypothetical protein